MEKHKIIKKIPDVMPASTHYLKHKSAHNVTTKKTDNKFKSGSARKQQTDTFD